MSPDIHVCTSLLPFWLTVIDFPWWLILLSFPSSLSSSSSLKYFSSYFVYKIENPLQSEPIHVGLKQNSPKWNHQGENEVDIYHLDIGRWRQAVTHLNRSIDKVRWISWSWHSHWWTRLLGRAWLWGSQSQWPQRRKVWRSLWSSWSCSGARWGRR